MNPARKSPLADFLQHRGLSRRADPLAATPRPSRRGRRAGGPGPLSPPGWLAVEGNLVLQFPLCSGRARGNQPSCPKFHAVGQGPAAPQGCSEQLQQGEGELFSHTGGLKLQLLVLSLSVLIILITCLVSGFCSLGNFEQGTWGEYTLSIWESVIYRNKQLLIVCLLKV